MCMFLIWDYGTRAHHFLPSWLNVIRFWQVTLSSPVCWGSFVFSHGLSTRSESRELFCSLMPLLPGWPLFFLIWSFGLHSDLQIKALDSPRASRGCSLAHGHSSLLVSSPLLTLSLEFLDHISFWPDHSVILTMCRLCLLPRPLLTGENDHRRGKQVMGGSCSPLHPPGAPDISPSVGGLT